MIGRRKFEVLKYPGSYIDGRWLTTNVTPTISTIYASLHPISDNELQSLDEGRRTQSNFKLISNSQLSVGKIGESNPDIIRFDNGEVYEVVKCDRWMNGILMHYRIIISKVEQ
jgi:hypothetical protein